MQLFFTVLILIMFTAKVGKSVAITAVCTLPKIEIRGVAMRGNLKPKTPWNRAAAKETTKLYKKVHPHLTYQV